jgi:hypothetical protein
MLLIFIRYLFWKSLFPKEMLDSPIIAEQFMKALYMIDESISLGSEASIRFVIFIILVIFFKKKYH